MNKILAIIIIIILICGLVIHSYKKNPWENLPWGQNVYTEPTIIQQNQ